MAQHISIISSKLSSLKAFQKVRDSLQKRARIGGGASASSLKFEELPHTDYKMNSNDRVFVTQRTVNGNKEIFELHFDTKEQKLLDIFLVK